MARGNQKSNALKVNLRDDYNEGFDEGKRQRELDFDGKDRDLLEKVRKFIKVETLLPKPNEKPSWPYNQPYNYAEFTQGKDFFDAVEGYNGSAPANRTRREQKMLKEELVEAFEKLPKELKLMLMKPKSFIDKLYRGSTHPANPGQDGKVNASFTTIKKHAEFFVKASVLNMQGSSVQYPKKQSRVYSSSDIVSFDRIIDISKAAKIAKIVDFLRNEEGFRSKKLPTELNLTYNDEAEYMVTNIKWRKPNGKG